MAGHGSPIATRWQFVLRARRKLPIVGCCALWMLLGVASAAAADPTLRVRVIWGGGTEQTWRGTISAPGAVVTKLQPLGIEPDQAGSIWTDGRTIFVDQRGPHTFDGVDFSITAPLDTLLSIELFTRGEKRDTHAVDFKLADLIRRRHETEKDTNRNWLLARRAPGDQLRVRTGRSSLVFATGERLRFDIEPHLLGLPKGTSLRVRSVLRKVGGLPAAEADYKLLSLETERRLVRELYDFNRVVRLAAETLRPNLVANALFQIAKEFSRTYVTSPVLKAETPQLRAARLALFTAAGKVLQRGMGLLGMEPPERL